MRTWSVSGTAFAWCTRSSSLSISTRTSIGRQFTLAHQTARRQASRLLGRVLGSAGSAVRIELAETARDRLGNELGDAPAERRDLLHAARRDERDARARHHVHRLDLRRE